MKFQFPKFKSSLTKFLRRYNLQIFAQPGALVVGLVMLFSIVSISVLIPRHANSVGVDDATPLNGGTVALANQVADDGGTRIKTIVYGGASAENLASLIRTAKDRGISVDLRSGGGISAEEYAGIVNGALEQVGSIPNDLLWVSCCSNEPVYDEPKTVDDEAEDLQIFLNSLNNKDSIKFSGHVINGTAGAKEVQYYVDTMIKCGQLCINNIDFFAVNIHGDIGAHLSPLIQAMGLLVNNPQFLIYEISAMNPDRSPLTLDQLGRFISDCYASSNCIDVNLFNAYFSNGQFVDKNWHGLSQSEIKAFIASLKTTPQYSQQTVNTLFKYYLLAEAGDPSCVQGSVCYAQAALFYKALIEMYANIDFAYNNLGTQDLFGISSRITLNSCGGGALSYNFLVDRKDGTVDANDVAIGIIASYYDNNGIFIDRQALGGSPIYGGNMNRPGTGTPDDAGTIIHLPPGADDFINHTVNYTVIAATGGEVKFDLDFGFSSSEGYNHALNECVVKINPGGSCGAVTCTGGSGNSLFCRANNDRVDPAPKKQPVDAPPVAACTDAGSDISLSYIDRGISTSTEKRYKLGFEITGVQVVGALAEDSETYWMFDNDGEDPTQNTPVAISNRIAAGTDLKSEKEDGYVQAGLSNFDIKLNGKDRTNTQTNKVYNLARTRVDSGIDLLEYVFAKMCYHDSALSPDQAPCMQMFEGAEPLKIESYDDLGADPYYQQLRDDTILSCAPEYNNTSYTQPKGNAYSGGSGSYVINDWTMFPDPKSFNADIGDIEISVKSNISLQVQRVNWMVSAMLSNQAEFMSTLFADKENFDEYYKTCLVDSITQTGGAAKVDYRFVLFEAKDLQCKPGQIKVDQYEWKVVENGPVGSAYIPGLGTIYTFLSQVPPEGDTTVNGMSLNFNPTYSNPCNLENVSN